MHWTKKFHEAGTKEAPFFDAFGSCGADRAQNQC